MTRQSSPQDDLSATEHVSPGRHKQRWVSRTWIHTVTGDEITVEAGSKDKCEDLFKRDVPEPREWREKK